MYLNFRKNALAGCHMRCRCPGERPSASRIRHHHDGDSRVAGGFYFPNIKSNQPVSRLHLVPRFHVSGEAVPVHRHSVQTNVEQQFHAIGQCDSTGVETAFHHHGYGSVRRGHQHR